MTGVFSFGDDSIWLGVEIAQSLALHCPLGRMKVPTCSRGGEGKAAHAAHELAVSSLERRGAARERACYHLLRLSARTCACAGSIHGSQVFPPGGPPENRNYVNTAVPSYKIPETRNRCQFSNKLTFMECSRPVHVSAARQHFGFSRTNKNERNCR